MKRIWLRTGLIFVLLLIWWKLLYFGYHPHSDMIVALVWCSNQPSLTLIEICIVSEGRKEPCSLGYGSFHARYFCLVSFPTKVTGRSCHFGFLADDPGNVSNIINWERFQFTHGCFCLHLASIKLSTFPSVCSAWFFCSDNKCWILHKNNFLTFLLPSSVLSYIHIHLLQKQKINVLY